MDNWKEIDINTDSLWIIGERDKSGKHSNVYHGNFIPQIPNQLIRRYTKENDVVLDVFMGSGTTLFECEKLNRQFIGFDINENIIKYVKGQMLDSKTAYQINECDVVNEQNFNTAMQTSLSNLQKKNVQFVIAHPPYMDIVKFTDKAEDLSLISDLTSFVNKFVQVMNNALCYLDNKKYFGIVIGDVYKNSEVIPLAFYVLDAIKRNFKVKLKGIIVKNIEGNRGKIGVNNIWKYRALKSDYFIFKHEYILVFKKES
ncbi:MAG: site-specific DNA-methyltransferase [Bacteroidales bacterium]|jgi:16S rRNA G966 N2-methylase RsmD|nr:site-specific DNA-methyltransferase [Bacteroidales bacterium]